MLMKILFSELRSAVMVTLALAVVCCGLYPLVVFGIAQVFSTTRPTAASSWTPTARCMARA